MIFRNVSSGHFLPHCVFSTESSNGLPLRMHSNTGYMCLTFLHCAISNVSSNAVHRKRHSRIAIGCISRLFSFQFHFDIYLGRVEFGQLQMEDLQLDKIQSKQATEKM